MSEAGDELKRLSPGERKYHSHLLSAWLLLQAVRQGLQLLAPLGAGDAVPAAAGNDPASRRLTWPWSMCGEAAQRGQPH